MQERELKITAVSGGVGIAAWVLGGPLAGLLMAGAGYLIAKKQLPLQEQPWLNLAEIVLSEESEKLEFKQLFSDNKNAISRGIIKTIAAFMNTKGGELIIGVSDKHTIVGIDQDIKKHGSADRLESALRNSLKDNLGIAKAKLCRIKIESHGDKTVCRINVMPSKEKVFVLKGAFFKRNGNQTISLSPGDYHELEQKEANKSVFPMNE